MFSNKFHSHQPDQLSQISAGHHLLIKLKTWLRVLRIESKIEAVLREVRCITAKYVDLGIDKHELLIIQMIVNSLQLRNAIYILWVRSIHTGSINKTSTGARIGVCMSHERTDSVVDQSGDNDVEILAEPIKSISIPRDPNYEGSNNRGEYLH